MMDDRIRRDLEQYILEQKNKERQTKFRYIDVVLIDIRIGKELLKLYPLNKGVEWK
jgi:hypothetical protein